MTSCLRYWLHSPTHHSALRALTYIKTKNVREVFVCVCVRMCSIHDDVRYQGDATAPICSRCQTLWRLGVLQAMPFSLFVNPLPISLLVSHRLPTSYFLSLSLSCSSSLTTLGSLFLCCTQCSFSLRCRQRLLPQRQNSSICTLCCMRLHITRLLNE